jgi:hypothetical protein
LCDNFSPPPVVPEHDLTVPGMMEMDGGELK